MPESDFLSICSQVVPRARQWRKLRGFWKNVISSSCIQESNSLPQNWSLPVSLFLPHLSLSLLLKLHPSFKIFLPKSHLSPRICLAQLTSRYPLLECPPLSPVNWGGGGEWESTMAQIQPNVIILWVNTGWTQMSLRAPPPLFFLRNTRHRCNKKH